MKWVSTLAPEQQATLKPTLACKRGKAFVSVCGSPDSLYPTCNKSFEAACKDSGGTTSSCGPDGSACKVTVNCLDNSHLYHACDEKFIVACGRDMGGTFECTGECDDESCCVGSCSRPDGK